jgi:hypothetical protein
MDIEVRLDCSNEDWETVSDTLKSVEMGHYEPNVHKKAFKNSYLFLYIMTIG